MARHALGYADSGDGRTHVPDHVHRDQLGGNDDPGVHADGRRTAPAFTGSTSTTAFIGRSFSYTVQTTGSPAAAITMTGTLPKGVTFVDNHNGTGRLSGTPARGTAKTYTLSFTATNVYGTATRTFFLQVI